MKRRFSQLAAVAVAVVALMVVLGHSARSWRRKSDGPISRPTTRSLAGGQALRGLAIELYQSDRRYRYERELSELAEMRSQIVCLSVRGWQENVSASRVFIDHAAIPTDEALVAAMRRARELGMQVLLLPIVLLWDTDSSEDWRGVINPRNWDRWWESYERFIVHYARLAQEAGAEMFSVGSELISTEHMRDRWLHVIRKVRQAYSGKILYSGNWDHYVQVSFWDALDLIGMTSYHTLATNNTPTSRELLNNWAPIKREILEWQREQGKPIVFTEVGYPSQDGAAREPWNYYGTMRVDLAEQYLCLRAFFETWRDEPAVAAIVVWKWERGGGPKDVNYTPRGKPSEELVRRWLLGGPLGEAPASQPAPTLEPDTGPRLIRPADDDEPDWVM